MNMQTPKGPQRSQNPQMRVNVEDLIDITCNECDHDVFREVVFIKKLSKLASPNGKEQKFPIPAFECVECGHINDEFYDFDRG